MIRGFFPIRERVIIPDPGIGCWRNRPPEGGIANGRNDFAALATLPYHHP
jgi:hypothetical protein